MYKMSSLHAVCAQYQIMDQLSIEFMLMFRRPRRGVGNCLGASL